MTTGPAMAPEPPHTQDAVVDAATRELASSLGGLGGPAAVPDRDGAPDETPGEIPSEVLDGVLRAGAQLHLTLQARLSDLSG